MKYNEWKLITESLAGGVTLGLSRPNVVGGLIGSQFNEEDFEDDNDDVETDEEGGDEGDDDADADDEGDDDLEGDLLNSSEEDGVEKGFPPDDSEEMDGLPTPDEEMLGDEEEGGLEGGEDELGDALAAAGEPAAPEDMLSGEKGDDFGDELSSALGATEKGAPAGPKGGEEADMDFLGDIDTALLGGEEGGDVPPAIGGEEDGEEGSEKVGAEVPCPDCNADGEPECPTCGGTGFTGDAPDASAEEVPDGDVDVELSNDPVDDQAKDTMDLMAMMAAYMGKYMKKEAAQYDEVAPAVAAAAAGGGAAGAGGMGGALGGMARAALPHFASGAGTAVANNLMNRQQQQQQPQPQRMMKKFMKKDDRKHCHCEGSSFLDSLAKSAKGDVHNKYKSGLSEDALFSALDPNYDSEDADRPGQVGYAPQGRVGSIGGGYTKDDFADIQVLGESYRFPTLNEWIANRSKRGKK